MSDNDLASLLRTVVTRLFKKLRTETTTGQQLSLTERSTLSLLHQHGQLISTELATMEKVTNQSMSQVISHLTALGYITKIASETDKRKVFISLSDKGKSFIQQVQQEREEWLARAIHDNFTEDEKKLLAKALTPLNRLIDFD